MLSNNTQLGATTQGTTFADIIINNVSGVADGVIQGFAQFVHDPKSLKETVSIFSKAAAPRKFADAVVLRRIETQKLDDIWRFPLNMSVPTTCPIPWTLVEASVKSAINVLSWEFNIMRTIDFIGRNYVRLVLPEIDTSKIIDSGIDKLEDVMSDPSHIYLGAWHRDLIPRIIEKVSFYPRSNAHKLFEYTGYDIYIHNILFGNAHKEMNDLMAGEDKFELCYDPYRVDGSAMGLASFKGIDAFAEYSVAAPDANGKIAYTNQATISGSDGILDYFQLDTTMDNEEFRNVYRRNVWYEAPVAKNYHARHSIHSRRLFHRAKDIVIPLDILPFGYSIASSLPASALSGECGFIRIELYADWLDRAFYLTKASDIPSLHPLVNHLHYAANSVTPDGNKIGAEGTDPRFGWVDERSLGRYGDPSFRKDTADTGDVSANYNAMEGNVLNVPIGYNRRDNIVPATPSFTGGSGGSLWSNNGRMRIPGPTDNGTIKTKGNWSGVSRQSTATTYTAYGSTERLSDEGANNFIYKMSLIDSSLYDELHDKIGVKLLQVGYQTLPCIREFLSKLPNIYITTEWNDMTTDINTTRFDINNDLYIQGIILWFIPTDNNNIESLRLYPCHMIDHEYPIIPGLTLINEQSQGTTTYDWSTLNVLNPAQMELNPLIENMGLISFSPSLTANTLPMAYYDSNISGYLKCILKSGEDSSDLGTPINMKQGKLKVITIGVNGVASVNLNLFRLVF